MSHLNGLRVFYGTTGSFQGNLNLDLEINAWAKKYGLEIINTSISTGKSYYIPGRQVTHYDVLTSVVFKLPSSSHNVPNKPTITDVGYTTKSGFRVIWNAVSPTSTDVEFYLLYINQITTTPVPFKKIFAKSGVNTFDFDDLNPNTTYQVSISAIDAFGFEGPVSDLSVQVTTLPLHP